MGEERLGWCGALPNRNRDRLTWGRGRQGNWENSSSTRARGAPGKESAGKAGDVTEGDMGSLHSCLHGRGKAMGITYEEAGALFNSLVSSAKSVIFIPIGDWAIKYAIRRDFESKFFFSPEKVIIQAENQCPPVAREQELRSSFRSLRTWLGRRLRGGGHGAYRRGVHIPRYDKWGVGSRGLWDCTPVIFSVPPRPLGVTCLGRLPILNGSWLAPRKGMSRPCCSLFFVAEWRFQSFVRVSGPQTW